MYKKVRIAQNVYKESNYEVKSTFSVKTETLEIEAEPTINGRKAIMVKYESKLANQLASYSLIKKDIKFCKKNLLLAIKFSGGNLNNQEFIYIRDEEDEISDILKSLTLSLIITYGKFFSKSEASRITLNAKEIFKKNSKLMERHEFIIQLRNQYVAHAGLTTHESVKTIILLDEDPSKRVTPKITTFSNHMYCFEQNGFELFLELVEHIDKNVVEMSRKVFERIVNKELKNVSDEKLYELAKKKKPLAL